MTDLNFTTIFTVIIGAIPTTITALAALLQSRKNARKTDVIIQKADEIHTLTNSNLTRVNADLALANQRIADLEAFVKKLMETKNGPSGI